MDCSQWLNGIEPQALLSTVLCTVNLVVQDAVASVPAYCDALNTLITFVQDSPKCLWLFRSMQPATWSKGTSTLLPNTQGATCMCTGLSYIELKASGFATQQSLFQVYFNSASLKKALTAIGTVNEAMQSSLARCSQTAVESTGTASFFTPRALRS